MTKIRIGGVPEHFNLPWHLCMEEGIFKNENLDVSWEDFPGGTGSMCKALRENEIDVAIILTEGVIKDIIEGNNSKIAQTYIATPLLWGIHVAENSPFQKISDLEDKKAAISRKGSGSHLMAYVNAEKMGWDTENLDFEIVKDIDGAVESLTTDTAQYFMWEQFTTKPLVDKGIFRRVGNCPTPWPCFVVAVRNDFFHSEKAAVEKMLQLINEKTRNFKQIPSIEKTLAERYDQKQEDIEQWLQLTEWSQSQLTKEQIEEVQEKLFQLKLIDRKVDSKELVFQF